MITPFHAGELAVQDRLGVRAAVAPMGARFIRDHMLDQHRTFYASLPFFVLGTLDHTGHPWASIVTGAPGFVYSPDPETLVIRAALSVQLQSHLTIGAAVGGLGIEPPTRRRNRINGRVIQASPAEIHIAVDQSYGNCPKYIHRRPFVTHNLAGTSTEHRLLAGDALAQVAAADTFFIASRSRLLDGSAHGVDVSHRGGPAGSVQVSPDGKSLLFPDYRGNRMYQTLGNLEQDARAGLVFVQPDTGARVHIRGRAQTIWDVAGLDGLDGASRAVRVQICSVSVTR